MLPLRGKGVRSSTLTLEARSSLRVPRYRKHFSPSTLSLRRGRALFLKIFVIPSCFKKILPNLLRSLPCRSFFPLPFTFSAKRIFSFFKTASHRDEGIVKKALMLSYFVQLAMDACLFDFPSTTPLDFFSLGFVPLMAFPQLTPPVANVVLRPSFPLPPFRGTPSEGKGPLPSSTRAFFPF